MVDQASCATQDRLLRLVRQLLADPYGSRPLSPEAALTDIGLSSIDMVNLMLEVEAEFDLTIPQSDITPDNFRSISTVEALVLRLDQPTAWPQNHAAPASRSDVEYGIVPATRR